PCETRHAPRMARGKRDFEALGRGIGKTVHAVSPEVLVLALLAIRDHGRTRRLEPFDGVLERLFVHRVEGRTRAVAGGCHRLDQPGRPGDAADRFGRDCHRESSSLVVAVIHSKRLTYLNYVTFTQFRTGAGGTIIRPRFRFRGNNMQLVEHPSVLSNEFGPVLNALAALKRGERGVRLPSEWSGLAGKVADTFNDVASQNERMAEELARLRLAVGKQGKLRERGSIGDVHGFWRESIHDVNSLIEDLVHPTTETARVIGAVAQGDLSQKMALEVEGDPMQGEFLRTATTINKMVDQLGSFASEVTRVAREVGTEGKLGGQARVRGVAGTWKDLTDSVNFMASNLTSQVRNIAEVTTAVASGDLSKKITVD